MITVYVICDLFTYTSPKTLGLSSKMVMIPFSINVFGPLQWLQRILLSAYLNQHVSAVLLCLRPINVSPSVLKMESQCPHYLTGLHVRAENAFLSLKTRVTTSSAAMTKLYVRQSIPGSGHAKCAMASLNDGMSQK